MHIHFLRDTDFLFSFLFQTYPHPTCIFTLSEMQTLFFSLSDFPLSSFFFQTDPHPSNPLSYMHIHSVRDTDSFLFTFRLTLNLDLHAYSLFSLSLSLTLVHVSISYNFTALDSFTLSLVLTLLFGLTHTGAPLASSPTFNRPLTQSWPCGGAQ